jgi:hypothetical protein
MNNVTQWHPIAPPHPCSHRSPALASRRSVTSPVAVTRRLRMCIVQQGLTTRGQPMVHGPPPAARRGAQQLAARVCGCNRLRKRHAMLGP